MMERRYTLLPCIVSILLLAGACGSQRASQSSSDSDKQAAGADKTDEARATPQPKAKPMTPCEKAMKSIRDRDFSDWRGLEPTCDWSALTGPLPTDWQDVPGRPLGSSFRDAKMIMLPLQNYMRPSLSFVAGSPVLFEAMGPKLTTELATLLAALGEPAARLDWDFGTLPCPESEFVYPDRGITLFLNSDHDRLLHVALYAATDLDEYGKNLRPRLGKTLHPMK